MDTVSKRKRSEIMSRIKSKDSKIETLFRKKLWQHGFRYRKNSGNHFGKPDIVLKKHETVIFIDSCFWHGCKKHCRVPTARKKYWVGKISRNKERDKQVAKHYRKINWKIFRVWEHQINEESKLENAINRIKKKYNKVSGRAQFTPYPSCARPDKN